MIISTLTYRRIQKEAKRIREFIGDLAILEAPKLTASRKVLEAYIAAWNRKVEENTREAARTCEFLKKKMRDRKRELKGIPA